MLKKMNEYIRCPICGSTFELVVIEENATEITDGILQCKDCGYMANIACGVVNLLYGLDAPTLRELRLHAADSKEYFERELAYGNRAALERKWAYMEQESSKEYGKSVKNIFFQTIKNVDGLDGAVVLDIGAGTGWSSAQLAKMGAYCIAIDLLEPIKLGLSKVFLDEGAYFERCLANVMRLPFADDSVDAVVAMAALHHATDMGRAMSEISRVLKQGGKLILIGEPVVPPDYIGTDPGYLKEKTKGFNEHQYSAPAWFQFAEAAGMRALDGTTSSDNLDRYYQLNEDEIQTPLPVFVKREVKTKLKIALLSQEYSRTCGGGNCRHTYLLAHGLARAGHDVRVVARSDRETDYDYVDEDVTVHKVVPRPVEGLPWEPDLAVSKKNLEYSYAVCQKLLDLVAQGEVDIVEAVSWDAEAFVFSLYRPVPLVVRIVTPLFKLMESEGWEVTRDRKLAHWLEGETVRRADHVIAISDAIGNLFREHHDVPAEKITLAGLGCELPPEQQLTRNNGRATVNILFVGRLERRKGIDTLFDAIPGVVDAFPGAQFWIAGKDTNLAPGGQSFQRYLSGTLQEKYRSHVRFFGFVAEEQLRELYRTCDVFVAPSLYESFGQIYIEAAAWGKPVIGCDVGGVPEVIEHGVTGLVVPPADRRALAEAIIRLTDKDAAAVMGANGRKAVERRFSIDNFVSSTSRIYAEVIRRGIKDGPPATPVK